MIKYRGYYIDHVTFNSKEEIDSFLKEKAISSYKRACRMAVNHSDMEHSIFAYEKAEILHSQFGLDWSEIEALELEAIA